MNNISQQDKANYYGVELKRFSCSGYRSVLAVSMTDAAEIFAVRAARKQYGRSGVVRTMRRDSWAQDGSSATYQAFIGTPHKDGSVSGSNEWICVTAHDN